MEFATGSKEVYLIVPDMPFFSNEKNGELEYIFNNFKYPTGESQFTFQLQFVIDTDGRLVGERIMDKSQFGVTIMDASYPQFISYNDQGEEMYAYNDNMQYAVPYFKPSRLSKTLLTSK